MCPCLKTRGELTGSRLIFDILQSQELTRCCFTLPFIRCSRRLTTETLRLTRLRSNRPSVVSPHAHQQIAHITPDHYHLGLPLEIVPAGQELAEPAGELKVAKKMSLADCFAAALAKREKAELYTGDPEFKTVEREIKVAWQ